MVAIVTRAGKGSPLTNAEVDSNFTNLNAGKLETSNNLSDLANAATARTNLGLGTLSTLSSISLSGDATGTSDGAGALALTLANSGVTAGSYGSSTSVPVVTVDAKGRVTSLSTQSISGSLTFTGDVTGTGSTGSSTALTLANSGVTAGTYTKVTVDAKGRVTTGASLASGDLPTYTGSLTSTQVTTALGFTPYNSTNPNSYITTDGTARTIVENNGTVVGTRRSLNFIPGTGISLSIADDSANEEVDITINSTGVTTFNTRSGAVTLSSSDVTTALGYTPYNSTNPTGYITSSALSSYLPLAGGTVTGVTSFQSNLGGTSGSLSGPPLQVFATGTNAAFMSFHRSGSFAVNMGLDNDNVLRIGGWSASANRFQMDMSGNLTMAGNVTAYSDERLKADWTELPSDFVERLAEIKRGVYTRTDSGERQAGVSAQQMRGILPESVSEDSAGFLSLAYGNAALVAAVELAKRIVRLEARFERTE